MKQRRLPAYQVDALALGEQRYRRMRGYIAYDKGLPFADCPYEGKDAEAWQEGWRLAQASAGRWNLIKDKDK